MLNLFLILIGLLSVLLIGSILIQKPKGGGLDSTFGGGSASQFFGAAKSADFIEKLTWGIAIAIALFSIMAAYLIENTASSGL